MKTIAITGSSGFIGSHLVRKLRNLQYDVLEIDIKNRINLLEFDELVKIPKFDTIIHLASLSFVPFSFKNPRLFYENNYRMTLNALELCRKYNSKMVFFSSYVYGNPKYLPVDELHPVSPHNPYAQSKIICEKLCEGYNRDFNVPIIIFRPFNIYGIGQNSSFLIPSIIKQSINGMVKLKDPKPKRDYIYIDDVVNAVINSISLTTTSVELMNLGSGKSFSVREIMEVFIRITNSKSEFTFSNEVRKGEISNTIANISHCKKLLNWEPKISFEDGIGKIVDYYKFYSDSILVK